MATLPLLKMQHQRHEPQNRVCLKSPIKTVPQCPGVFIIQRVFCLCSNIATLLSYVNYLRTQKVLQNICLISTIICVTKYTTYET